ncbi:PREDICTED: ADP-ribosylation factor-like protein 5 [Lupinus angustifolius]|uniref:ADP-ribosylation factor-like protein 5 n=1 Tax=Lupinus angustifolius TaxID=3871 RepID=UPI00092F3DFE|nr:PREDICTED: ADP-ribosylation factor-like protein 5 [Lupinus angustifolius]
MYMIRRIRILGWIQSGASDAPCPDVGASDVHWSSAGAPDAPWLGADAPHVSGLVSGMYRGTHAVIAVTESSDRAKISIMKDELFRLLRHEQLRTSVILVFANKQDIKDAMTLAEIIDALSLHSIKDHDWHIQACSALSGEGLYNGLGWISQQVTGKVQT